MAAAACCPLTRRRGRTGPNCTSLLHFYCISRSAVCCEGLQVFCRDWVAQAIGAKWLRGCSACVRTSTSPKARERTGGAQCLAAKAKLRRQRRAGGRRDGRGWFLGTVIECLTREFGSDSRLASTASRCAGAAVGTAPCFMQARAGRSGLCSALARMAGQAHPHDASCCTSFDPASLPWLLVSQLVVERAKWQNCWEAIKFCSDRCKSEGKRAKRQQQPQQPKAQGEAQGEAQQQQQGEAQGGGASRPSGGVDNSSGLAA